MNLEYLWHKFSKTNISSSFSSRYLTHTAMQGEGGGGGVIPMVLGVHALPQLLANNFFFSEIFMPPTSELMMKNRMRAYIIVIVLTYSV